MLETLQGQAWDAEGTGQECRGDRQGMLRGQSEDAVGTGWGCSAALTFPGARGGQLE